MARDLWRWTALLMLLSSVPAVAQFHKSAGAAIDEATRDSAKQPHSQTAEKPDSATNVKVLTDTKGFNVDLYRDNVYPRIRTSWYSAVHELVKKPDERQGAVVAELTILRSGEIQSVQVVDSSGQKDLDEAVFQGIQRASPLPPLPKALPPNELKMRIHFLYKGQKPSKWWGH